MMSLCINSPAYYTYHYGVIEEISNMCNLISQIDIKKYTKELDNVGITPIIAPMSEIKNNRFLEIRKVMLKSRLAIIALHIDFEKFMKADIETKKEMVLCNILSSLRVIKAKLKNKFCYEELELEITNLMG